MKFPKILYVVTESDSDNSVWFSASDDVIAFAEIGKPRKVAIYKLDHQTYVSAQVKIDKP